MNLRSFGAVSLVLFHLAVGVRGWYDPGHRPRECSRDDDCDEKNKEPSCGGHCVCNPYGYCVVPRDEAPAATARAAGGRHVRGGAAALAGARQAVRGAAAAGWGSSSSDDGPSISKALKVHLDKVTNLFGRDVVGTSDVYVTLEVEKDQFGFNKSFGKKTSKKVDSLSPEYDETFEWLLSDLDDMLLIVKVMDSDVGFDDKMGKVELKLDKLGLSATEKSVVEVVDKRRSGEDAKVYLDITYK